MKKKIRKNFFFRKKGINQEELLFFEAKRKSEAQQKILQWNEHFQAVPAQRKEKQLENDSKTEIWKAVRTKSDLLFPFTEKAHLDGS